MKNLYLTLSAIFFSVALYAQGPAPITGPTNLCVGATGVLNDATTGGTWSVSNSAIASISTGVGIITGVSPGTCTVFYTTSGGSASTIVSFNPGPATFALTGGGAYCIGGYGVHIGLSGSTPGCTYQLYNGATVVGASIVGTGVPLDFGLCTALGIYTAAATNTVTGCVSLMIGTAAVAITGPAASFSGPGTVCVGSPIAFTDSLSGGIWGSGNTAIATIDPSGNAFGVSAGTVTINDSFGGGCVATKTVIVTVGACTGTPVAGAATAGTIPCVGNAITLALSGAATTCGIGYQWQSSPDGASFTDISGGNIPIYTFNFASSAYYRSKLTCSSSGLSSYSSPIYIGANSVIAAHSILSTPDTFCSGADFYISACGTSPSFNVTTWYGDGTSGNLPLTSSGVCHADIIHAYSSPGTYNVKQVLYIGTIPQDSVSFSYEYLYCNTLPVNFYFDANSDCVYDAGDGIILLPVTIEIDSSGIPIDTVSATSGLYYKAHGPIGTVYAFKVISAPGGIHVSCPSAGIIYDTIQTTVNDYHQKSFGFNCTGGAAFDLAEHVSTQTGRHMQSGNIIVDNTFCTPENAIVTVTFSPQYIFQYAYPSPSSVAGNTITWDFSGISSSSPTYPNISYTLTVPSAWLIPGDTINSNYITNGTIVGDIDTTNNHIQRCDTVKASYDPNEMSVLPGGNILPCTKLQYTINFENTGNDTAHNISVMDTLSDDLDPHSLNIEIASSVMNIAMIKDAGHNIVKFDFPNINLLDSSHHNQCNGLVIFNIKTKPGLITGTSIANYAGIFFDDNPVVMTDTAMNIIGLNPITGPGSVCSGASVTLSAPTGFSGGVWSSGSTSIAVIGSSTGVVTGVSASSANITYTVANSCGSVAATAPLMVAPLPAAYHLTGGGGYCTGGAGVDMGLDSSNIGVNYFLYIGAASAGPFSGTGAALDFGLQTAAGTYTVVASNPATSCSGSMADSAIVSLLPGVTPAVSIMANDTVCVGSPVTFMPVPVNGGTSPSYLWSVNGTSVSAGSFYSFTPANGDVVTVALTSSVPCATPATTSSTITMAVESLLTPSVSIAASPATTIGAGQEVTLTATISGGGVTASYQWSVNSVLIPGATNAAYTSNTFLNNDVAACIVTTGNICGDIMAQNSALITVSNVGVTNIGHSDGVRLFPNPNNGTFTIEGFTGNINPDEVSIIITDMVGQAVYKNTVTAANGNINEQVQLGNSLAKGMYLLNLRSGTGSRVFHFVIE